MSTADLIAWSIGSTIAEADRLLRLPYRRRSLALSPRAIEVIRIDRAAGVITYGHRRRFDRVRRALWKAVAA